MNILTDNRNEEFTSYILRRWVKESRRFKPTAPFHTLRKCEDRTRCAFHRRRNG